MNEKTEEIMKYNLNAEQEAKCFPEQKAEFFPTLINSVYKKVYVVGALKNPAVLTVAARLRLELNCKVFDDWHAAHPDADDAWRDYEQSRGRSYADALKALAGQNVFKFDKRHLNASTHGILVLPAGRSGHLELGYLAGRGLATAILLDVDYDRWDVMYAFADIVTRDIEEVIDAWKR